MKRLEGYEELGLEMKEERTRLLEENSALHEQLAKCVERVLELEIEVKRYRELTITDERIRQLIREKVIAKAKKER